MTPIEKESKGIIGTEKAGIDLWDILQPVDIIPKLPEQFKEDVGSKKWLERKTALDSLLQLLSENRKLSTEAQYGWLIDILKKVLEKDANINVASTATKCLTALAKGLRGKFGCSVRSLVPVIFDKFKEKKAVLRDPLLECVDAICSTTNLDTISGEILAALSKPNSSIKVQVNLFLYRSFRDMNPEAIPKKLLNDLVPVLAKQTSDSDVEVREAACASLGGMIKCIGQKTAVVLLSNLITDNATMAKMEEFCAKAGEEGKKMLGLGEKFTGSIRSLAPIITDNLKEETVEEFCDKATEERKEMLGLEGKFPDSVCSLAPIITDNLEEEKTKAILHDPLPECSQVVCSTVDLNSTSDDIVAALLNLRIQDTPNRTAVVTNQIKSQDSPSIEQETMEIDVWDILEPVDIIPGRVESNKWPERKAALDSLLQLLSENRKLSTVAQYDWLVGILKKVGEICSTMTETPK